MTSVRIDWVGDEIAGFSISGHSGYAQSGEDIVCAAISAISQTAALGLTELLKANVNMRIDPVKGSMRLSLGQHAPTEAQIILRTMLLGLENIQLQYPDYIRINRNGGGIT